MANEVSLTTAAAYAKNGQGFIAPGVTALAISVTGNGVSEGIMAAAVAPGIALPLAGLANPFGWLFMRNLDTSATITLTDVSGGHIFATMFPGETCALRLGSGVTAPFVVSSAGVPLVSFLLLPP